VQAIKPEPLVDSDDVPLDEPLPSFEAVAPAPRVLQDQVVEDVPLVDSEAAAAEAEGLYF
jgi:hypothetical protein